MANGSSYAEGRVEICLSDEWGTVCDRMWDVTDASVVCRQLGLASNSKEIYICIQLFHALLSSASAVEPLKGGSFGEGTGRMWLDNVQCTGSERILVNCTASIGGVNSCSHAQDAGVRCPSGNKRLS